MLWQQIKCFRTGIKLPCHSKVSLAADMPCQLQVCEVLGGSASKLPGHHHHISLMELGHLLIRSGLTYLEVSSQVCHDSFCQLGNSVSYLVSSTYIMILHCHLEPFAHCMCWLVYFVIGINSSYFHRPVKQWRSNGFSFQ
jgi:hypothetical protein